MHVPPPRTAGVPESPLSVPCSETHDPEKSEDRTDGSFASLDLRQENATMNPNQKGAKKNQKGLRLWNHTRALAALPYVRSILRSLREHRLEVQQQRHNAHRLADRPGRPDRAALVAHQDALQESQRADLRYEEALKELQNLGITCLDPVKGHALFPFVHKKRLAWFLFDLFEAEPLHFWRYQDDPEDVRRPVNVSEEDTSGRIA